MPRLTRKQAVEWLNANGYPIAQRHFEKLSAPSNGAGPEPVAVFGSRYLYEEAGLRAWGESRLKRRGDDAQQAA
jgi:hypothetical protein